MCRAATPSPRCTASSVPRRSHVEARRRPGYHCPRGALAEWLGTGLQNLVHRFDSGRRLHFPQSARETRTHSLAAARFVLDPDRAGHERSGFGSPLENRWVRIRGPADAEASVVWLRWTKPLLRRAPRYHLARTAFLEMMQSPNYSDRLRSWWQRLIRKDRGQVSRQRTDFPEACWVLVPALYRVASRAELRAQGERRLAAVDLEARGRPPLCRSILEANTSRRAMSSSGRSSAFASGSPGRDDQVGCAELGHRRQDPARTWKAASETRTQRASCGDR
jgi:hypothetical protein